MNAPILASIAALAVTMASAPAARRFLHRMGRIDVPNDRSLHTTPIPRGGGIACGLGVASGALVAAAFGAPVPWPALAAAVALALVGFIDDRAHLRAHPRLIAQILTGAALGASLGGPALAILGAVVMPLVVNAVNFMDGINGLTALTLGIWGGATLLAGLHHDVPSLALIGALSTGAALGFLPWNAPRARVFLGDVGSYLFGALIAGGLLVGSSSGISPMLLAAPLAVYAVDVGSTLVRRAIRREDLFVAHRDHVYQRLVSRAGLSHIAVSVWASLLALAITVVWYLANPAVAIFATGLLLSVYMSSVPITIALVRRAENSATSKAASR